MPKKEIVIIDGKKYIKRPSIPYERCDKCKYIKGELYQQDIDRGTICTCGKSKVINLSKYL